LLPVFGAASWFLQAVAASVTAVLLKAAGANEVATHVHVVVVF
jgi:phenylpyruvate tautomerase PptA (4-oxalocrotonate tautomerase family)